LVYGLQNGSIDLDRIRLAGLNAVTLSRDA
jgi:hypothetical protein